MKRKRFLKRLSQFSLFAERPLILLVSVVTLLLQLISFATTWNGSKIYLEGIFPYASLFFAVAVQATAYFFSNSLRSRITFLKVVALGVALCCSTYYSYIGIYNSVNSPVTYLQERYVTITRSLNRIYTAELDTTLADAQEAVNDAASAIVTRYTALLSTRENIAACQTALSEIQSSYTDNMKAPSRYSFANYEDYAAAYQAYIEAISQNNNTENEAARALTLSSYGYSSMEELNQALQQNVAHITALQTALGTVDDVNTAVAGLSGSLSTAIANAGRGIPFTSTDTDCLNRLLQAAKLCGQEGNRLATLTGAINQCAQISSQDLMQDYTGLTNALPEKKVTDSNTMQLKSMMDAEILSALLHLNTLLPASKQIALTDPTYEITDLYLVPIKAIQEDSTKTVAFFCLLVAALVDALSVLFAFSLRPGKPLWKRRFLTLCRMEDYEPMIYAALPNIATSAQTLESFLAHFTPSPQTEGEGYMLKAALNTLTDYHALSALLCQINLAKIIPAGYLNNDTDLLLLKARVVFWMNHIIYDAREEALYE